MRLEVRGLCANSQTAQSGKAGAQHALRTPNRSISCGNESNGSQKLTRKAPYLRSLGESVFPPVELSAAFLPAMFEMQTWGWGWCVWLLNKAGVCVCLFLFLTHTDILRSFEVFYTCCLVVFIPTTFSEGIHQRCPQRFTRKCSLLVELSHDTVRMWKLLFRGMEAVLYKLSI